MTPSDPNAEPPSHAPPAPPTQAELAQIRHEVEHLFRHSLRQGRINPLMHVIMAHRAHELP